jgi:phosphopantetheinyl transferase
VVSPAPVGVDIEAVRDLDPRAIRLVATPHERSLIERWTPSRAAALRLWTVKEAVLKGLGTGFRTDPRSVRVVEADSHTARVDAAGGPDTPGARWRVSSEILEDRVVSIAHVGSHICSARIRWIDRAGVSAALDTP